jgi:hypothetical protein
MFPSSMQPSQGFIIDSYHLYSIAKDAYYKAEQGFATQRQNDALVAIVFAALSLEAFINELSTLAKDAKANGNSDAFLDRLIDAIDETHIENQKDKTTRAKFLNTSNALSEKFDMGKKPYQDFADLFRLRDCLVHLKPEDRLEVDLDDNLVYSGRKLIDRLRSRNILLDSTEVKSLPLLVSTTKAAKWACTTAARMVIAILDKIPDSEFSKDNQVLALYRSMFQPLASDDQQVSVQEHQNRQTSILQIDELRTRLLETYGEFPDSTELILEDRSR